MREAVIAEGCEELADESLRAESICSVEFEGASVKRILNSVMSGISLESLSLPDGLESIGKYSLSSTKINRGIVFPASMSSIGYHFAWKAQIPTIDLSKCVNLTSLPESSFQECFKTTSIILPPNLEIIASSCFLVASQIGELEVPEAVKLLGRRCFERCFSLKRVVFKGRLIKEIPESCFLSSGITAIEMPSSVAKIGVAAFKDCQKLSSINSLESIESVSAEAFMGCSALEVLRFGAILSAVTPGSLSKMGKCDRIEVESLNEDYESSDGVLYSKGLSVLVAFPGGRERAVICRECREIGMMAFANSSALRTVSFENSTAEGRLEAIGASTFMGCANLRSVSIPRSVSEVSSSAFAGCAGLERVTLKRGSALARLCEGGFRGCPRLAAFEIESGSSLESIEGGVFEGCRSLRLFSFPRGLVSIGERAFAGCEVLSSAVLPDTLVTISSESFKGCCGFLSVRIPLSVESIGREAFANSGLKDIYFCRICTDNCMFSGDAFSGLPGEPIAHVPISFQGGTYLGLQSVGDLDKDCMRGTIGFTSSGEAVFSSSAALAACALMAREE